MTFTGIYLALIMLCKLNNRPSVAFQPITNTSNNVAIQPATQFFITQDEVKTSSETTSSSVSLVDLMTFKTSRGNNSQKKTLTGKILN